MWFLVEAVYGELTGEFDLNDNDDRCSLETASMRDLRAHEPRKKMLLNIFAAAACFRRHKSISVISTSSTLAAAILVCAYDPTAAQLRRNTQNTYHHFPTAALQPFDSPLFFSSVFDGNFNCLLNGCENDWLAVSVKFNCQINVYNVLTGNNNV